MNSELEEVIAKIKDANSLPTHKEAMQLFKRFAASHSWSDVCGECGIYNAHTVESVGGLAKEIVGLNALPITEICAGNGKLSHQLRKRGINIVATNDYSYGLSKNENLVEKLSHIDALKKYNPGTVIASWIPYATRIGFDVLDFPSVRYFIDI